MPIIHEGPAKVEYSTETKTLYVSGKYGVVLRLEGINLPEEFKDITMLDVKVEATTVTVIRGATVTSPG